MDSLGFLGKMGVKDVSLWATAYSAVDNAVPFLSESFTVNYERIQIESLIGSGGKEPSEQGNQSIPGTTEHELDFDNFLEILTHAIGSEAAGTITLENRLQNALWLEFEKQTARYRFGASRCTKWTVSGEKGGLIKAAFDWFARDFDDNAAAFPAISPTASLKARFLDVDFWLGDQADALAAGDRFEIDSFELSCDRALKGDDYVATGAAATAKLPVDPVEGAKRTVALSITMPRKSADTIVAWKQADTALQAKIDIARGGTGGGLYLFSLPHLVIPDGFDSPISGDAPLTIEGNFECAVTTNGSHPMSITEELEVDWTS